MSKEKNERLPGERSQRRGKKVGNMEPNWRKTQKWERGGQKWTLKGAVLYICDLFVINLVENSTRDDTQAQQEK